MRIQGIGAVDPLASGRSVRKRRRLGVLASRDDHAFRRRGQGATTRLAVGLTLLALGVGPCRALDARKAITQYSRRVWQTENGLPQNSVAAMVQSRDGYIWLGTQEGLVRFDGVRFTVFDRSNTRELKNNNVGALLEDRAGRLWIGTLGGLTRLQQGRFTSYTTADGLSHDSVRSLFEDREGRLWIGTSGGLNRLDGNRFIRYTAETGVPQTAVRAIVEGRDGRLWVGTNSGLACLKDGKATVYTTRDGLSNDAIRSIAETVDGSLWLGTGGGGLNRFENGHFRVFGGEEGLSNNVVVSLKLDRHGNLWVGTWGGGLNRFRDGRLSVFGKKDGLSSDFVPALCEDREGNLWVGTLYGGLTRLSDAAFTSYTTREGLSNDSASAIYQDRQGRIWFGTAGGGLNLWTNGEFRAYGRREGLSHDVIYSICDDAEGNLWVATYGGGVNRFRAGRFTAFRTTEGMGSNLTTAVYCDREGNVWIGTAGGGLNRLTGGRITIYRQKDGLLNDEVYAIFQDREANLWFGTWGGGLSRLRAGQFSNYTTKDGLANDFVYAIHQDHEGTLWIGTHGGGLSRFRDGRFTTYNTDNGLFDNVVYQILEDDFGNFWMTCNKGVFRVSKNDLEEVARGRQRAVRSAVYGIADGMKSGECNGGGQPAGWKTSDGKLWFPTTQGVAMIDPAAIVRNSFVPPVVIEQAIVDKRTRSAGSDLVFPPGRGEMEIRYTALSFRVPERVQFRYKLEGFDGEWIDAGNRRVAYYTNIPPGRYAFRVIARNDDGVWNLQGASLAFSLKPHFYQTYWFLGLCTGVILLAAFGGHRLRVRHLTQRKYELIRLVTERTQQLQEANRSLQQLTIRDGLTGAANHRYFKQCLDEEWHRSQRYRRPLSLLMIDVDFFESYNDIYGHPAGDVCLKVVADILRDTVTRPTDLLARYGGEEFAVILGENNALGAISVAEKIRSRVYARNIPHAASRIEDRVTVSVGVAAMIPTADGEPASLVAAADRALHLAKKEGRNRVKAFQPASPASALPASRR